MRSRVRTGSVVQDKRDKVWRFYWWEDGRRRSKALGRFSTKADAWRAAKPLRDSLEAHAEVISSAAPTVKGLVEQSPKLKNAYSERYKARLRIVGSESIFCRSGDIGQSQIYKHAL